MKFQNIYMYVEKKQQSNHVYTTKSHSFFLSKKKKKRSHSFLLGQSPTLLKIKVQNKKLNNKYVGSLPVTV